MQIIAFWLDFFAKDPMKREGTFRFTYFLVENLILNYNKRIELWYFPATRLVVEESFSSLKKTHPNNLIFKTIKTKSRISAFFYSFFLLFRMAFGSTYVESTIPYKLFINYIAPSHNFFLKLLDEKIFKLFFYGAQSASFFFSSFFQKFFPKKQPLIEKLTLCANKTSNASFFVIPSLGQRVSIGLRQKKIFIAHDFITIEFEKEFQQYDSKTLKINQFIKYFINELNNQESLFVCHCEHVKESHLKKYFPKIPDSSIKKIFLPVNGLSAIKLPILSRSEIYKKYNINSNFIIYPSQLRPHKNMITLLKAFNLIKEKTKVKLFLTWQDTTQDTIEYRFIKKNNLLPYLILPGEITESDLYALYQHASLTVVTTLFEGGFPWQAMESMLMKTPVLISNIPMVNERLSYINTLPEFSPFLFTPTDENELAEKILIALEDKDKTYQKQKNTADLLLNYSWKDTASKYLEIFEKWSKSE